MDHKFNKITSACFIINLLCYYDLFHIHSLCNKDSYCLLMNHWENNTTKGKSPFRENPKLPENMCFGLLKLFLNSA